MKPLDFVKTPSGAFAIVTEISEYQGEGATQRTASIRFIGPTGPGDFSAWWPVGQLTYLDSLPNLLTMSLLHPFSSNKQLAKTFFKKEL